MKITHVIAALTKGGAERVVVDLANVSSAAAHKVTIVVAYPVDAVLLQNALSSNVQLLQIQPEKKSALKIYLSLIPWVWANRNWLRGQDVLHFHLTLGAIMATLCWFMFRWKYPRPIIVETNHSIGVYIKKWQRYLFWLTARWRDGYVLMAEDNEWQTHLKKSSMPLMQFIPNGVDLPQITFELSARRAVRSNIGLPDYPHLVVGTVGRMAAERNPVAMIETFAKIVFHLKGLAKVHFLMAGAGPEMDVVRRRVAALGLIDLVTLPGLVIDSRSVMSIMDLYLTMNVGVTTGVAGLEAATQGIPVIAIQMQSDHRLGATDWIWSSNSPDEVAREAVKILLDHRMRTELADAQRQYAIENFSAQKMASRYVDFYKKTQAAFRLKSGF